MVTGNADVVGGHSIAQWEWDFNYDGKTFDFDAGGPEAIFSAGELDGPGEVTIALRLREEGDLLSNVATAKVRITDAAPTAVLSGGSTSLGSAGAVGFYMVRDSAADLSAGLTYSYDLNNDGVYEITGSSPDCEIPAGYLAALGNHTVHGRIADRSAHSASTPQISE